MSATDGDSCGEASPGTAVIDSVPELGRTLRLLLRRARGTTGRKLTCRELADQTGYSHSAINNWLEGRSLPSADRLGDLLIALHATDPEQRALGTARDQIEERHRASMRAAAPPGSGTEQSAVPRELPPDVGAFTGRAAELTELDRLLAVTGSPDGADEEPTAVVISAVAGAAGVGKTALAVRWAHKVRALFPDGQLYVNLRGYDPAQPMTATDALARFLRALGKNDQEIPQEEDERAACFRSLIAGRRMLLILDNAASAEQARPLLPGTRSVAVVVTSRDSLTGLIARDGARRLDLDLMPAADAVVLLRALIGDRVDADPDAAQMLARQCDYLPLALRVAAELVADRPAMPLAELVDELVDQAKRLDLLDAGGDVRSAVRSVFSWSVQRLPALAARTFRLLGLHPGPNFDPCAVAALTGITFGQARDVLGVLVRAHLVQPGPVRHSMHDLLRAYATELSNSQDPGPAQRALLTGLFDYYLAAAAAAMDTLVPAERGYRPRIPPPAALLPDLADPVTAQGWLDAELPTLVAVSSCTAAHGWPCHAVRLAATLPRYLDLGHNSEAIAIYTNALQAARGSRDLAGEAAALVSLGSVHKRQGRHQLAAGHHQEGLALFRELGDQLGEARSLGNLGNDYERQRRYSEAVRCYSQAFVLFREVGDQLGEARTLSNLGLVQGREGRYQEATRHHERALILFRELEDRLGEARTLGNLGDVCQRQGSCQEAGSYQQRALALFRELGDRNGEADSLTDLGIVRQRQGSYQEATAHHRHALMLFRELGDRTGEARTLSNLGDVCQRQGSCQEAISCHQQALALSRDVGDRYCEALALMGLGAVCQRQDRHVEAAANHQQARALFQQIGDRGGEAEALNGAGESLLALGQPGQAQTCHTAALALAQGTGDRHEEARALTGLSSVCLHAGGRGQGHRDLDQVPL
jgi:tetratricopeptide (TPR) repeat protein/transcriptional regulator with XRE-family HTH domain